MLLFDICLSTINKCQCVKHLYSLYLFIRLDKCLIICLTSFLNKSLFFIIELLNFMFFIRVIKCRCDSPVTIIGIGYKLNVTTIDCFKFIVFSVFIDI